MKGKEWVRKRDEHWNRKVVKANHNHSHKYTYIHTHARITCWRKSFSFSVRSSAMALCLPKSTFKAKHEFPMKLILHNEIIVATDALSCPTCFAGIAVTAFAITQSAKQIDPFRLLKPFFSLYFCLLDSFFLFMLNHHNVWVAFITLHTLHSSI